MAPGTIEVDSADVSTGEAFVMQALDFITFRFEKETPGTARFRELSEDGEPLEIRQAVIGTLYLRKPYWETLGRPYEVVVQVGVKR